MAAACLLACGCIPLPELIIRDTDKPYAGYQYAP
jgi:hypothetical protein